jgi:cell division protein FtsN
MADLDAPEIQSSGSGRGKQVFFLVMSALVVAIVIFLLGVSVGRGVRKSGPPTDAGDAGDTTVAATPSVKTTPADLSYHDALQGTAAGNDAGKPAAPPAPPAAPAPTVSHAPAKPTSPAAEKPVAPAPAGRSASSTQTEYSVQVGAFKTQAAAQSQVAQVKAKDRSYPVSTVTLPESQPLPFKVVVGPYPTLEDANRVAERLKRDGFATIIRH